MEELNEIAISDLSSYCRTCLQMCKGEGYEVDSLPTTLLHLFMLYVPYKKSQKNFPTLLCPLCYEALRSFDEFRSTAMRVTQFLVQSLRTKSHALATKNEALTNSYLIAPEVEEANAVQDELPEKVGTPSSSKISSSAFEEENLEEEEELPENFDVESGSEQEMNFEEIYMKAESEFEAYNNELKVRLMGQPKNETRKKKTTSKLEDTEKPAEKKYYLIRGRLSEKLNYTCPHCDRSFRYTTTLSKHLMEDHNIEATLNACPHENCKKTFEHPESAEQHYRLNHEPLAKKKIFICEQCGDSFDNSTKFKKHQYRHDPDARPYQCELCDKRFVLKSSYKEHQLRHAGIKKYKCPYCEIKKTSIRELRAHINFHTKEKEYRCTLCPKVFYWRNALINHDRLVHKGIRSFKCQYCDKAFGKPDARRFHEMRHTGERPHKCTICEKGFLQARSLTNHMKTHEKKEKII